MTEPHGWKLRPNPYAKKSTAGPTYVTHAQNAAPEVKAYDNPLPTVEEVRRWQGDLTNEEALQLARQDGRLSDGGGIISVSTDFCGIPSVSYQEESSTSMGGQSQFRSTHKKRVAKLPCKKRKFKKQRGDDYEVDYSNQRTLLGGVAFDPLKRCNLCIDHNFNKFAAIKRTVTKHGHHKACPNRPFNKKLLRGSLQNDFEDRQKWERENSITNQKPKRPANQFFTSYPTSVRPPKMSNVTVTPTPRATSMEADVELTGTSPEQTSREMAAYVEASLKDEKFVEQHDKPRGAPLPIMAVAKWLYKTKLPAKPSVASREKFADLLAVIPENSLALRIPDNLGTYVADKPNFFSIQGQTLYFVNWKSQFPTVSIPCPAGCRDHMGERVEMKSERTSYGKYKSLFPIYNLTGVPSWCAVTTYKCEECKAEFKGNDGRLLAVLPPHVRNCYPVEMKYAGGASFHFHRDASLLFGETLLTYSNGDHLHRVMYRAMNNEYTRRATEYFSLWCNVPGTPPPFPKDIGVFFKVYPPMGERIRETFADASTSILTLSGISDKDRHEREIQAVGCNFLIAQDHTMEVTKNYRSEEVGAKALWDVITESGEIACAVLVPNTSVRMIAHAAECLQRRGNFSTKIMYADTWPHKEEFWKLIFGPNLEGRLGLFHFINRIQRTMRQHHTDYADALHGLLMSVYNWHPTDYENLLNAMTAGLVGGKKFTTSEIAKFEKTKNFRSNFAEKYLRKIMLPEAMIRQNLEHWFNRYKVTSSDPELRPAEGRLDPKSGKCLFTQDTKSAVTECMKKCGHISDKVGLDKLYREVPATARMKHNLSQWKSLRGESKLEGFHHPLAHFANNGMSAKMADIVNLMGTARYNVEVRAKNNVDEDLLQDLKDDGKNSRLAYIPRHYDQSELHAINQLGLAAGYPGVLFLDVQPVAPNNGEKFFSEYYFQQVERVETSLRHPVNDLCTCHLCVSHIARATNGGIPPSPAQQHYFAAGRTQTKNVQPMDSATSQLHAILPTPTSNRTTSPFEAVTTATSKRTAIISSFPSASLTLASAFPVQLFTPNLHAHAMRPDPYNYLSVHPYVPPRAVRTSLNQQICCVMYHNWLWKKNGRPPHATNCPVATSRRQSKVKHK